MFHIIYKDKFKKKLQKFLKKHPDIREKFKSSVKNLENNPFESSLKTHKLTGKLKDNYACSINHEYRIILSIVIIKEEVFLIDIGTHNEVYK